MIYTKIMRKILHCDLNGFYASVECLLDDTLVGKAVAVTGSLTDRHGVVVAKNEQAKKLGIKTGMTAFEAKKLAPDIVFRETHFDVYQKYSRAVKQLLFEYTDYVESFGIDEAWLDVTNCKRFDGDAYKIAYDIKERIKFEIGLTVSIGISFNKVFAKLGSDLKKPDAISVISYENFREIIYPLPVENLLYVGKATKRKLNKLMIRTIGDLAASDENLLIKHLGKWGSVVYCYATGRDLEPVKKFNEYSEYKSVGNSLTFYRDLDNNLDVETLLLLLSESVCARMAEYGFRFARTVTLTITNHLLSSITRMAKLDHPSNSSTDVADLAMKLFVKNFDWQTKVRGLGVSVSDFTNEDQISFDEDMSKVSKKENLEHTIEYLRSRFGRSAIHRAVALREDKFAVLDIKDRSAGTSLGKKNKED